MGEISNLTPVPLSGFLNLSAVSWQIRVPRPCFVPQPFLGFSLQSVPLTRIVYPSRGLQLPCGYPPTCWKARRVSLSAAISPDVHTLRRSCLDPPRPMSPHSTSRSSLPGRPGPRAAEPFRSVSFTRFEACSSCESVRTNPSCPGPAVDTLLGVLPLQRQTLRTSEPLPARTRRPKHSPPPEGFGLRRCGLNASPKESLCPLRRVRPAQRYE